ncbi:YopX family protein [Bacillus cereus]|nr:hypothetical protein [Bacillus cereus]
MREIKFRAWDEELKEMYSGDEIEGERNLDAWLSYGELAIYRIDDGEYVQLKPLQFTGIRDKNGKEIYEGDIISTDLSRPFLVVEFRDGAFMVHCHDNEQDYYDHMEPAFSEVVELTKYHEVIGNIYENPELIKTK